MMMGPEPMIRIFLRSVRLGIFLLIIGATARTEVSARPQYSFPLSVTLKAPTGAVMRVYFPLQAKAGEAARQVERLEDILSIVFFCAYQGQ